MELPFEFGMVRPPPRHPPPPQTFAPTPQGRGNSNVTPRGHQYNRGQHRGNFFRGRGGPNRGGFRSHPPPRGGPNMRYQEHGNFQRHNAHQQYRSKETHSDDEEEHFEDGTSHRDSFYWKPSFIEDPWAPIFNRMGMTDPYPSSVLPPSSVSVEKETKQKEVTRSFSDSAEIPIEEPQVCWFHSLIAVI